VGVFPPPCFWPGIFGFAGFLGESRKMFFLGRHSLVKLESTFKQVAVDTDECCQMTNCGRTCELYLLRFYMLLSLHQLDYL
jgi:hypothetical protein